MQTKWVGLSSDDFFRRYGPPATQFQLANGDTLYSWTGGQASVGIPATTTGNYNALTGTFISTTSGGGEINMSCSARITASGPQRIIKDIAPSRDTIGAWNLSRCAEIFG